MSYTIYRITNQSTGRTYIGMTEQALPIRFGSHVRALHRGDHTNEYLQADFNDAHTDLSIKALRTCSDKEQAHAAEMRQVARETNPYNIRTAKPGAMAGRRQRRHINLYVYQEIAALKGKLSHRDICARYGVSQPLVSMIQNGHRCRELPQTSFSSVMSDPNTLIDLPKPKATR